MSKQNFTDKQLQNLSLDEIKKIVAQEKKGLKKDYKELEEKRKLIEKYRKLTEFRKKVKQGKVIKKKPQVIKTFEDYFEECIKNKKIPKDTPSYLRKALERVIKEYEQGIVIEKSALGEFAKKYIIKGEPDILPYQFFRNKKQVIKDFLRNHRNTKVRFVLDCIMEKQEKIQGDSKLTFKVQDKSYFHSNTFNNFNSTDVKDLLSKSYREIIESISTYQENGSGWYFKEIVQLEIHTTEFKPVKGSSYIPLPDWIMRKKAIVSIRNKDDKCFLWSVLRYLHPREKNDSRLSDLKKYEFSLNTKGITFPMKGIAGKRIKPIIYTKTSEDEDVAKVFVEKLTELTKGIYNDFYCRPKPLVMNPKTQKEFNDAVNCHICSKELGMIKLEIIVILQVITVEQHITNVILCVKNQEYYELYFTIFRVMMLICL
ncbi:unnamed protein product [Porites evermanni]|uniref:Uncharacterized protein n=1 Tax=Porites evermanni TaxID=104178 RepID=A0ABN8MDV0_9CNID|nr:unnamed protein product [Porites evermanni]